ncbi:hypothetical protein [Chitinophaga nivalis]|uniref:DUF4175 domain-containing protein n=1 Tax=Chitinophaga nivalis TaxID=2991709 RepID=A0ABT3IKY7_9BACT|nr:hypothetical protein [Chitinophaga nivalis]MCW3465686.1 hypothetical protein [Chitinophaga nivalis]MCW3484623.1 hypothetical protein [Chitinophaga nivalis]
MKAPDFLTLWGMPLLLGVLILFGLIAALTGTGIWHWLSWAALCVPLVVLGWYLFKKETPAKK